MASGREQRDDPQDRGRRIFERLTEELVQAIGEGFSSGSHSAVQILLYLGIEILAGLDRPAGKEQVDRADFRRWVKTYMLTGDGETLPCDEFDLYAARLSIGFPTTLEAAGTRPSKARVIFPVYNPAEVAALQKKLDSASFDGRRGVAVGIAELITSFVAGVDRFKDAVTSDPKKASRVYDRVRKVPLCMPSSLLGSAAGGEGGASEFVQVYGGGDIPLASVNVYGGGGFAPSSKRPGQ